MSIEAGFSAATFPSLRNANQDVTDAQARVQGHAAGYAAGLRVAAAEAEARAAELAAEAAAELDERHAQIDATLAALDAAAIELHGRSIPTVEQAQDVLVSSAIELAEAILGYELKDGKTSARSALARVLEHADPKTMLAVRMNPADIAQLDDASRSATSVEIVADPAIDRGDAVADFADGYLDARIATALARARAALLGETI